jgi:hypothetical protein
MVGRGLHGTAAEKTIVCIFVSLRILNLEIHKPFGPHKMPEILCVAERLSDSHETLLYSHVRMTAALSVLIQCIGTLQTAFFCVEFEVRCHAVA